MNAILSHMSKVTETMRVKTETAKKLRQLAAHADMSVPDFLSVKFSPLVDEWFAEMVRELTKEAKPTGKSKS